MMYATSAEALAEMFRLLERRTDYAEIGDGLQIQPVEEGAFRMFRVVTVEKGFEEEQVFVSDVGETVRVIVALTTTLTTGGAEVFARMVDAAGVFGALIEGRREAARETAARQVEEARHARW